jgi:hypothetical protein
MRSWLLVVTIECHTFFVLFFGKKNKKCVHSKKQQILFGWLSLQVLWAGFTV